MNTQNDHAHKGIKTRIKNARVRVGAYLGSEL